MRATRAGLVDIVREFLVAHALMRRLSARHEEGELRFADFQELVGGGEEAVLFRLKERCHALFRPAPSATGRPSHREALVDLAVGSLFHEAMTLRENLYQREIYGPRVRELLPHAGDESSALFDEFGRMMATITQRIREGMRETDALFSQTAQQLLMLLADEPGDGLVARYLVESAAEVERVFAAPLPEVLATVHGSAAEGFLAAGRSLLASGYYDDAALALDEAERQGGARERIAPLRAYAKGMSAYLARDYAESVARLGEWADAADEGPESLRRVAHEAMSRIGQLAEGAERERLAPSAAALAARLAPAHRRPAARPPRRPSPPARS